MAPPQFVPHGHAVIALKALAKKYDNMEVDHERVKAVYLAMSILDAVNMIELANKYMPSIKKLIDAAVGNKLEPVQSFQCAIELAALINYDLGHHDIEGIFDYLCALVQPYGGLESPVPNSYTDARNVSSALISLYLLELRYSKRLSGLTGRLKTLYDNVAAYTRKCRTYSGGYAMSPCGEEHGGGALLNVIPVVLMNRIIDFLGLGWTHLQIDDPDLIYRMVQRQQMVFSGRPNKPECLCYVLWLYGALAALGHDDLVNKQLMVNTLLNCQFKMTPSVAEQLILKALPKKRFEDCSDKAAWAAFLLAEYGEVRCGFVLAEDKPDLLHTFAALVGVLHAGPQKMPFDFCLFMKPERLASWTRQE